MRRGSNVRSLSTLILLPFALALAQVAPARTPPPPKPLVMGDSLSCPRAAPGELQVCARRITAADIFNLHAYAGCLVRHHRLAAADAVQTYVTRRSRDALRTLVVDDRYCTPEGATRVSAILLAGALAERLPGWQRRLRQGFAQSEPADDLVHCLIEADPSTPLAMLRATPLSPREGEATARLVAALSACLPVGVQLETHRAALRSLLALALFDPSTVIGESSFLRQASAPATLAEAGTPLTPTITAALAPVVTIKRPRPQLDFIPRLTPHTTHQNIRNSPWPEMEEDVIVRQMAWPIDPDTGEAPSADRDPDELTPEP